MDRGGVVVRAKGEVDEEAALGRGRQGVGGVLDGGCVGREFAPDREEAFGRVRTAQENLKKLPLANDPTLKERIEDLKERMVDARVQWRNIDNEEKAAGKKAWRVLSKLRAANREERYDRIHAALKSSEASRSEDEKLSQHRKRQLQKKRRKERLKFEAELAAEEQRMLDEAMEASRNDCTAFEPPPIVGRAAANPVPQVPSTTADDVSTECIVCMAEERTHVPTPCGHLCACAGCADAISKQNGPCPICRRPVTQWIKLRNA